MRKSAIILCFLLLTAPARAGWTPPVRISDEAPSYGPRIVAAGDTLHIVYWRGGHLLHPITYGLLTVDNHGASHFI